MPKKFNKEDFINQVNQKLNEYCVIIEDLKEEDIEYIGSFKTKKIIKIKEVLIEADVFAVAMFLTGQTF